MRFNAIYGTMGSQSKEVEKHEEAIDRTGIGFRAGSIVIACGSSTGTNEYVELAMESTTTAEATSELSIEMESQSLESESAAQTEAAASFSAGTTAQAAATSTTLATTTTTKLATAAPAAPVVVTQATTRSTAPTTQSTTTTRSTVTTTTTTAAPKPQTQPPAAQPVLEYLVMGPEFLGTAINALNEIRAEMGLAPMREDAALMASSLEQAWKMAKAEDCFHSENPHGCESVAYYPSQFFPAKVVGERLTYHSPGFREAQNVRVGIAVVQYDGYLYCVMQGDC